MDKPLLKVDHMIWDVEVPTSPVTITGMMTFGKRFSKKNLFRVLSERLLKFERFHHKVVVKNGNPYWKHDKDFALESHIFETTLPDPGGDYELQNLLGDLMSAKLDHQKPLWQLYIVKNYKEGTVLIWRLHHAIADGMALVKVIFSLTGDSSAVSLNLKNKTLSVRSASKKKPKETIWQSLQHSGESVYESATQLLREPHLLQDALQRSWDSGKEMVSLFTGNPLIKSPYKGELSTSKKAAWSAQLSLSDVKAVKSKFNATVNDVLLTLVTGALRAHLIKHGFKPKEGLRVVLPMNLRAKDEEVKLHNEIGMLSLELPVHLNDIVEQIRFITEKTNALKHSLEPVLINKLLQNISDFLTADARRKFAEFMGAKIAAVVTNVPGPDHPIYLAGSRVKDIMFWVPHTAPLGMGVSLITYNGKVYMGIVADTNVVDDPEFITSAFEKELAKLTKRKPRFI